MPRGERRIVDRFLRSLERAPGIHVVDADALLLQVLTPDDRIVEVRVEEDALLANARLVADDAALHGLSGTDSVERSFTLFFLHMQTAVRSGPPQGARRLRYTAQGVVRDGHAGTGSTPRMQ
ncbi:ABC transporter substrate-binding protein [Leifsonia sp. 1010]|uniref:ABC transporter substrate-binding protein n=1 Tax=Leifsonia sp. 1010 TaxID=2817769 RepID=UPI0028613253|nr:ABC transporter substrate-binding protein [Leifsonia sp. 1010]MDR6612722.1 hypothetical protein [Leifsonia sp. 1010]